MAETDFSRTAALNKKLYSSKVWRHAVEKSFWMNGGLMGKGMDDTGSPVTMVTKFTDSERGTACVMPLVRRLDTDSGVVGDNQLDGNEQSIDSDSLEIRIDMIRNAVKRKGQMSEQATVIRFRATGTEELGVWLAAVVDELGFLMAAGLSYTKRVDGTTRPATSQLPLLRFAADVLAPSTNRKKFGGTATSTATLTTGDVITWKKIVDVHAMMQAKLLKPVQKGSKEIYGLIMHPYVMRDLKKDADYIAIAKDADSRGTDVNQLFTGAARIVDGVPLYVNTRVPNTFGAASGSKYGASGTVDGVQCLAFGAQALAFAAMGDVTPITGKNDDYGNKPSVGIQQIIGWLKPNWLHTPDNPGSREDFSMVSLYVACTPG
jgi:N4-gp56 family major capsid protein